MANIFPPATLSIVTTNRNTSSMLQIPQVDFGSFKYAAAVVPGSGLQAWTHPSQAIQHVVSKIVTGGQLSSVTPPAPNATWSLDFWGPGLQCSYVPEDRAEKLMVNIWNSYYNDSSAATYAFLSWLPWSPVDYPLNINFTAEFKTSDDVIHHIRFNADGTKSIGQEADNPAPYLPFIYDLQGTYPISEPSNYLPAFYQYSNLTHFGPYPTRMGPTTATSATDGPLSLYIAILPGARDTRLRVNDTPEPTVIYKGLEFGWQKETNVSRQVLPTNQTARLYSPFSANNAFENATFLQCSLYNTSYSVDYGFINGEQTVRIANRTDARQIVGGHSFFNSMRGCTTFQREDTRGCGIDIGALHALSYQSILASFNMMITGSITMPASVDTDFNSLQQTIDTQSLIKTSILKTPLQDTEELAFLQYLLDSPNSSVIANVPKGYEGLVSSPTASVPRSLAATLEEAFQNLTLSLIAEPEFQ